MTTESALPSDDDVQRICDLVRGMAAGLVDEPEEMQIESETFDTETVIHLVVAEDDLEKFVDRQSRTARSLRTVVNAAGTRLQHRFILEIETDEQ